MMDAGSISAAALPGWANVGLEDARAILDNCSVAVHFVDANGTIIYANKAELDCLGYTAEEYLGRNITDFHACRETINDIFDRLKRQETLLNYEAELACKDGTRKVLQINSNVYWHNGEFVHTRCFSRDITDLKRAQLRLLEEQRLRLEEAEEYKRKQNDFIDMLCHELRNPLNGVLGLLACVREEMAGLRGAIREKDLVAAEHKAKYAAQFLAHIDECAQHQRVIMDDVLNLSRLETTNLGTAGHTTFDPRHTLESVVNMYNGMARMKHLQLLTNTDRVPPGAEGLVIADENRLKQILINLISNALKYSRDRGRVTITLRTKQKQVGGDGDGDGDGDDDQWVYLEGSVEDNGVGITDDAQALLFAPFAKLKRKRVLEYGGSGLGLRITKELVELMHGSISVRSAIGEGSVFTFVVRCGRPRPGTTAATLSDVRSSAGIHGREAAEALIKEAEERVQREASGATTAAQLRRPRVLVCEDNQINQMVLSRFLERRGIEYVVAPSGEDALRLYRDSLADKDDGGPPDQRRPFDLVFMDIELPGMNGIEATLQIRKVEEEHAGGKRRVPVVCMSGYTRSEYKLMAFGVGMNDYISKPFSKDKVYQLIDHYVLPS
ncbi:ATPase/histidine kinase/DNA gyrase B/HSP90 domain containing protein [Acanthamoeba castellanii str. Neff]|uniref:histidine kinase n=1 Tax=Acanthamoeba castellanii (strain ATCC 30010 / Neff) TaxID=1257118 RepID=L8GKB4_ACACF|nr:ATPase/histidine kinase/DNA gyrase B/HSP90 domain containing protein [Acanthamoeba castellanii str. Neff]ELR13520.1 ATPase/histidine kinase/DNA gyrase B/HSP90 domain containing protein [Acanthamoeba castellanii str. Neff]